MAIGGLQYSLELRKLQCACNELERQFAQSESTDEVKWSLSELEVRSEMLANSWDAFCNLHQRVKEEFGEIDGVIALCDSTCEEAIHYYASAKANFQQRIKNKVAIHAPKPLPKFAEIRLESFDGDYRKWTAWKAQFLAKVYETGLAADQKIDLLVGSITGAAAECVGQILNRDSAELERVWELMLKRFDNEYRLVLSHINRIINYPRLVAESADDLRKMIDTFDQQLRLLQRFQYDTDGWSPIIVGLILSKLDALTHSKWEMENEHRDMPKMKDLFNFLNRRIGALRNLNDAKPTHAATTHKSTDDMRYNSQYNTHGRNTRNDKHVAGTFHDKRTDDRSRIRRPQISNDSFAFAKGYGPGDSGVAKPPCPNVICGKPHRLWNCNAFARESFERQLKLIEEWRLCPSCLIEKHAAADCTRNGCPRCNNAKHNSLICPALRREKQERPQVKTNVARLGKRTFSASK